MSDYNFSWKQARLVARRHIERLNLPSRLDGCTVQITDYDDEDTLRFLKVEEPEITLQSQRLINQAFAREMRKRGATVVLVPVRMNDYFGWLGRFDLKDEPANRAQFIAWLTAPAPRPQPIR
jgi:hypothetical protein